METQPRTQRAIDTSFGDFLSTGQFMVNWGCFCIISFFQVLACIQPFTAYSHARMLPRSSHHIVWGRGTILTSGLWLRCTHLRLAAIGGVGIHTSTAGEPRVIRISISLRDLSCHVYFVMHVEIIISTAELFVLRWDLMADRKSHAWLDLYSVVHLIFAIAMVGSDRKSHQYNSVPFFLSKIVIVRCDPIEVNGWSTGLQQINLTWKKSFFTASFVSKTVNVIYCGLVSFGEVFNFTIFYEQEYGHN